MDNNHHSKGSDESLLKIVGLVMCVASIPYLFFGIPLALFLVGIPMVAFGIALIYYGMQVYGLKKGSDLGAIVVLLVGALWAFHFSWWPLLSLVGAYLIYTNRDKFVN